MRVGWADLGEGRLYLDHLPAMALRRLSSTAHSSRGNKVSGPPSPAALRPQAVTWLIAPGLWIAIEAAMGAAEHTRRLIVATIGTFTKGENGFSGQIKTVTLNVKAEFASAEKENEKAPDYRIFAGQGVEFGAAWKKTSNTGRQYLSVKLDDPSFLGAGVRLAGRGRGR